MQIRFPKWGRCCRAATLHSESPFHDSGQATSHTGRCLAIRKKRHGVRSEVMGKFYLASAHGMALVLCLGVACGNTDALTTNTGGSNSRGSHNVVSCKKDSQCPSGQRCGFTSAMKVKANASCQAAMLHALIPVAAVVAMVDPSIFSAQWVRVPNSRRLRYVPSGPAHELALRR